MDSVKCAAMAILCLWSAAASADPVDRWSPYMEEASSRFGVPEPWIRQVIRAESGGRTMLHGEPTQSPAGALGLMQLMPRTWHEMRALHGLGSDPQDARDNILAGTAYLRAMYDRFGYPGLFAAYNAGPARYAEHLVTGRALPSETVAYVAAVVGNPPRSRIDPEPGLSNGLFAVTAGGLAEPAAASTVPGSPPPSALFVRLSRDAGTLE